MKKFLIVIACLVAFLVLVIVGGGMMLPKDYELSRSIMIDAKPKAVHEYVGNLKKWEEWTPWKAHDESIVVTHGKKSTGAGASQTWTSKDGNGELTFTKSDKDTGVAYDMAFVAGEDRLPSQGSVTYEEAGKKTRVTWSMKGEMNIPIAGGWWAMTMDAWVGPMFDEGLANLKKKVEGK